MWGFNPKTIEYTYQQIITMLPRDIVDFGFTKNTDKIYQVPMVESLEYIMKKVPSWKCLYIPEKHDCDDFVRDFRGWLSRKNWGNLLAMDTEILLLNGIKHNLISFMNLNRKDSNGKYLLVFGEPQTGKLIPYEISLEYKNIKLRL